MRKIQFIGLPVLVLVFGLALVGCENGSTNESTPDSLNGTRWEASIGGGYTMVLTFNTPNYSLETLVTTESVNKETGTYTVSGDKITFADGGSSFTGTINGNELTIAATYTFTKKQ
jgi:hypothetical protein